MAKVLLVIGNGFDLKCGLESSFSQYLSSNYYSPFMAKLKTIDESLSSDLVFPSYYDGFAIYDSYKISFCGMTFWDLYFGLPYFYKVSDINEWYCFENKLCFFINSLVEETGDYEVIKNVSSTKVTYNSCNDKDYKRRLLLYLYLKDINASFDNNIINNTLFEQLRNYEKRFGEYICYLQRNDHNYLSRAKDLIGQMMNKETHDEVTYLNSFNYSDLSSIIKEVWHINGDIDNPIFGVDYPKSAPDDMERYKYTKTYRRLELHGNEKYYPKRKDYSKVIVYGHSLNSQDYNYFFALFNSLNLGVDRNGSRKGYYVEFIYSRYGDKSSEDVRKEVISRVLKMLHKYNKEVLREHNFRLIDILYSTGAIRFKEI